MSRKPDAQYAVRRVALRFGPDVETAKFCNATGLDASNVNAALVRTRCAGGVKIVSKRILPRAPHPPNIRRILLTYAGHVLPSECEDALLVKGQMKEPVRGLETKKRGRLKCRKEIQSSWPCGRVCAQCK